MQTLTLNAADSLAPSEHILVRVRDWLAKQVEEIISGCDKFLAETYRDLLCKEPSADLLREHRRASELMLRMTRPVLAELQNSELGNGPLTRELAARVRVMEANHDTLHNPMPAAEADALLAQAFPDAP